MRFVKSSGAAAIAAVMLVAVSGPVAAKGKCVLAGGEGSNVLPDVAKFMADAALKNSIAANGWKAAGKIKQTCKTEVLLTTCVSQQRACK